MKISDIPWYDRPGARISRDEIKELSDADLLSVIIGKGRKESVLELSNRLLNKYNLNKLEDLGLEELAEECKGDKIPALQILSFFELVKRYNKLIKGGYNRKVVNSAKDVYNMFVDEFRNYKKEVLSVVLLDAKNKVIKVKEVSVGTLDSSLAHPREIFKEAIKESANAVILVHNHPSGDCTPSKDDIETTKKLIDIGKVLGIPVLDHVIVGRDKYYSWREEN